jgi:hypothetical protein
LGVILAMVILRVFFFTVIPPWLQEGRDPVGVSLLGLWILYSMSALVFQFVGFGLLRILLSGSADEWREHIDVLSLPLSMIEANFRLTPDNTFLDLCGVLVGNSFFYALLVFLCYQPVRRAFRKNRPTRLSLSNVEETDTDK